MTDQPDAPDDTAAKPSPPEKEPKALPPAVWVTGLIVLVLLFLAIFALG